MSIKANITEEPKTARTYNRYTLENENGMRVCVIEYGCAVTHIFVPDKTGGLRDVVLGYESLAGYEAGTASLGALVGRCANRIEGAAFELGGRRYALEANDGPNHLHGCFGRKVFRGHLETPQDGAQRLVLKAHSPAGEDGFPGNMEVTVAYTLTADNALDGLHRHHRRGHPCQPHQPQLFQPGGLCQRQRAGTAAYHFAGRF